MTAQQMLFAGLVLTADQVTKAIIARRLAVGESESVGPWVRIRHVVTRFRSDGFMQSRLVLLLLWAIALDGIVFATRSGNFFQRSAAQMGLVAALAGAASNLYDQLRRRAVIDFLDLGWWPAFNLADIAITLGVVVAIWFV